MSGTSRNKMRNPLLSAAGPGFPFETYAENALLVPVTPATPAVLRDGEFPSATGAPGRGFPAATCESLGERRNAGRCEESLRFLSPDLVRIFVALLERRANICYVRGSLRGRYCRAERARVPRLAVKVPKECP